MLYFNKTQTTTEEGNGLNYFIFSKPMLKFSLHANKRKRQGLEGGSDCVRSALTCGKRNPMKGLRQMLFFLPFVVCHPGK